MTAPRRFLRVAVQCLHDAVYFVDAQRSITFFNQGAEDLTGHSEAEVLGRCCGPALFAHVDEHGNTLCETECPITAALAQGSAGERLVFLRHRQGHRIPADLRVAPVLGDSGEPVGAVVVFRQAYRSMDPPQAEQAGPNSVNAAGRGTLATRARLERRWGELAASAGHHATFGVLVIDIDVWDEVVQAQGSMVHESLSAIVAQTLAANLRGEDAVAPLGPARFAALLADSNGTRMSAVAERLRALVSQTVVHLPQGQLKPTVSIGATRYRTGETRHDCLARAEDLAFASRAAGGNLVSFDPAEVPKSGVQHKSIEPKPCGHSQAPKSVKKSG